MNMAEANGALLAAGDVSICYLFPKIPFHTQEIHKNTIILSNRNIVKYSAINVSFAFSYLVIHKYIFSFS